MAFTATDRNNIRDLFGHPWSMNDCIDDLLSTAFAEHGDDVVNAVRGHLTDADALEAEIDAEMGSSEVESVEIVGEVKTDLRAGSSILARKNSQLSAIKNKIRLAIDPYNQLYPQTATPLLRS